MKIKCLGDFGNSCVWLDIDSASFQLTIQQAEEIKNKLDEQLFNYKQLEEMCIASDENR